MTLHSKVQEKWQFSSIDNIEEPLFNRSLERFKEMGVSGLTRENIQNSLDGKLQDIEEPVIVKIKTGDIYEKDIPGIDEVKRRIENLKGFNKYTKETIEHMKNKLDQEVVRYISFEDVNTKGLTGARNGQSLSQKDTWSIYAYNKGVHFEEEDEKVETSRGGSHGVGKIASNAASDLHVMYFANCDAYGDQHLGGTVQLIEHEYNGKAYRSTGYFTKVKFDEHNRSKYYPFENHFHDAFKKDTRGLKIVIPYLRKEYDNEQEIIRSVCDSFFVSILNNKLIVFVNGKKISNETILNYVKSEEYYIQDIAEAKNDFTPLYVDTYLNSEVEKIVVNNREKDFHFDLYFRYDEKIPRGRVAIVRTIGMKIEDFKVRNNATKPFNAVLIGGPEEDAYLKSLENESHTKLSKHHINDERLKRNATRFINNLSNEIAKIIDEAIRENNQTDGLMDTKDILYVLETQFKKDLEKSLGTVRVKNGKTLVKSIGRVSKKEKRGKRENSSKPGITTGKNKKRDPLKWQKTNTETGSESEQKERYSAHPEMVDRVILKDREILRFDFTNSKQLQGVDRCDISLSVIDGMGVEYNDEFKIHDNYREVIDLNSGETCKFEKKYIRGVQIKNGIAELELLVREDFNPSLKFVYYVEV